MILVHRVVAGEAVMVEPARYRHGDEAIRAEIEAGDLGRATEMALENLGQEIFGFLCNRIDDPERAQDAFQTFSIELWQSFERFAWRSSLRTWAYRLARNIAVDQLRSAYDRRRRRLVTEEQSALAAHWGRTMTSPWLQTEAKHWVWQLIDEFEPDERELIELRIVHQHDWRQIAQITAEGDESLEEADIKRRAAALRKRFQRLKDVIRQRRDEFEA